MPTFLEPVAREPELVAAEAERARATGIPGVYGCILQVSRELAKEGISKDRANQQQGYKFRGIDDVFNALAPMLAKHGLVILPRMVDRTVTERQTKQGGVLFSVTVDAEFDFVCAADGSKHTVKTFGEAMDSADKATNKAMSAAYKYAAFQTFCIPTEGDNDADAVTHDVVAAPRPTTSSGVVREPENPVPVTGGDSRATSPIGHLGTLIRRVEEVPITSGKMAGKNKWFVHFEDGNKASTIDAALAGRAQQCCDAQARVQPELLHTKWGYDLKGLHVVPAPEFAHSEPVTDEEIPF